MAPFSMPIEPEQVIGIGSSVSHTKVASFTIKIRKKIII
jgi:hypothetical protein